MEPLLAAAAALWVNIKRVFVLLLHRESPSWHSVGANETPAKSHQGDPPHAICMISWC